MRVLHVIPSLELGGAPQGVVELLNSQRRKGMDVRLLVMGSRTQMLSRGVIDFPITFMELPWRFSSAILLRKHLSILAKIVSREKINLIHTHLLPADFIGARFVGSQTQKIAHVSHVRGTLPWLKNRGILNAIKRRMYRSAFRTANTYFICVSEEAKRYSEEAFALSPKRMSTVLNGIDFSRFSSPLHPEKRNRFLIGTAGRFCPEKGQEDLIRAVACVIKTGVPAKLTLAGSGGLESRLRCLADDLNISQEVHFAGEMYDMSTFYRSLDLFVLPSISSEGLARVLIEAMYCAAPIIATDACGNAEAIRHLQDGLLVPAQDIGALSRAIVEIYSQPPLAQRLAKSAHERALLQFNVERVVEQVSAIYANLLVG